MRVAGGDGWMVTLEVMGRPDDAAIGLVLTVPASRHERDGWGPALTAALVERRVVVAATDIRGRGDSREPLSMVSLPPGHLGAVRDDVAAAIDVLAERFQVAPGRMVLMGEQDTADAVTQAALADDRVGGLVLISPRLAPTTIEMASTRPLAVCVVASKEDAAGLESAVSLYAAGRDPRSRLRLVADVGSGTTMFAAWQYLRVGEPLLEHWLAAWVASLS